LRVACDAQLLFLRIGFSGAAVRRLQRASGGIEVMNFLGAIIESDFAASTQAFLVIRGMGLRRTWGDCPPPQAFFVRRVRPLALAVVVLLCAGQCFTGGLEDRNMSTAAPLANSLSQVTLRLPVPLVSVQVAQAALRRSGAEVVKLVEAGDLAWAWNIALDAKGKREIRIFARSLAELQRGTRTLTGDDSEFPSVIREIFPYAFLPRPGVVATVRVSTIARQISCGSKLVFGLMDAGLLRVVPGSPRHTGPNGSPEVQFSSVQNFMQARRIT
jgi:hypothetical protein